MGRNIIQVENLSKHYMIHHEKQDRYLALRDVVSRKARKIFSFPKSLQPTLPTKETFVALKNIDFDIAMGDRLGIIGRNGAGKSTLLKILSRITEPTEGKVTLRGRVASLLEVGTGFHPELTGRENIYLNGAILGMTRSEIRRKFDQIVSFAEVEKFLDTPVKRYSSGMYVRLAFAVAAHLEPEILIIDEVLAVGDVQFQKKCLGKMEDVSKSEGRTILFVSHNLVAVQNLCDKALLLDKGNLVADGPTKAVISQYLAESSQSSYMWVSDGKRYVNDFLSVESIRLYDSKDKSNFEFTTSTELEIEIASFILKEAELLFDIHLYNEEGVLVFDNCSHPQVFTNSAITVSCRIPSDLLNDGQYSITISVVVNHTVELFRIREALVFTLTESGRSVNWHGKWPGVIRPNLKWHIDKA
jgi:lipopolysaccharide transport system ATP-binding protein